MQTIIVLANEIPWVMAPASLIAAMLATLLIKVVFQITQKVFPPVALGVMLALAGGIAILLFLS
jgi:hypothetical protein